MRDHLEGWGGVGETGGGFGDEEDCAGAGDGFLRWRRRGSETGDGMDVREVAGTRDGEFEERVRDLWWEISDGRWEEGWEGEVRRRQCMRLALRALRL